METGTYYMISDAMLNEKEYYSKEDDTKNLDQKIEEFIKRTEKKEKEQNIIPNKLVIEKDNRFTATTRLPEDIDNTIDITGSYTVNEAYAKIGFTYDEQQNEKIPNDIIEYLNRLNTSKRYFTNGANPTDAEIIGHISISYDDKQPVHFPKSSQLRKYIASPEKSWNGKNYNSQYITTDLEDYIYAYDNIIVGNAYGYEMNEESNYSYGKKFSLKYNVVKYCNTAKPFEFPELNESEEKIFEQFGYTNTTINFENGKWEWIDDATNKIINNGIYKESKKYKGLIQMEIELVSERGWCFEPDMETLYTYEDDIISDNIVIEDTQTNINYLWQYFNNYLLYIDEDNYVYVPLYIK